GTLATLPPSLWRLATLATLPPRLGRLATVATLGAALSSRLGSAPSAVGLLRLGTSSRGRSDYDLDAAPRRSAGRLRAPLVTRLALAAGLALDVGELAEQPAHVHF